MTAAANRRYVVRAAYHAKPGYRFDLEHYFSVHVPLADRQMALGNLKFLRREVEYDYHDLFDQRPAESVLSVTYYFESEEDIQAFREFMKTELIDPLKEDVEKFTDCEISWTTAVVDVV